MYKVVLADEEELFFESLKEQVRGADAGFEIACVSPCYFSTFFKKATDENYMSSMDYRRVNRGM